ncbi:class I SAM-dependent methyltransferase [Pseudoflavitalea sp. G-6-1-2]|uniref:class I SAM-dependent methyltransferase n=1 Tax=Pseudoflavitalea sp. G-6-1-2 TaxID=2728841 RepID=UPI00146C8F3C|nr:class I SAM-dependent methyltransferase [Pseudoflavitalea sp. G-6-1-2]NML22894.1 class I SAM-dependent methyltransferase [Pseudoflavitalea sp. G-6-1-2]
MKKPETFWNRSADSYDKEEMSYSSTRFKLLARTKKQLSKQDHVLDFGCATGILATEIASDVHSVIGIDTASRMIEIAQDKSVDLHITNVAYSNIDIFDSTLRPSSFDAVLAIYLLHLLDNLPAYLNRIHDLMKPGGKFISLTPCPGKKSFIGNALLLAGKIGLIPSQTLFSVSELETHIANAGFRILSSECLAQKGRQQFIVAKKN